MSTGRRVAMATVVVVVSIQLLVPALALVLRDDRPTAFGWQMFAHAGPPPIVELVDRGGAATELPRREVRAAFGHYRPEIEFGDELARHLCDRSADVAEVVLRDPDTRDVELAHPC